MAWLKKTVVYLLSAATVFAMAGAMNLSVQAAALKPRLCIDTPKNGAALSENSQNVISISISGWAIAGSKIRSVTATFDGKAATGSTLNLSRADVAKAYSAYPYASTSGFKTNMLVVPSISYGSHIVTVTAVSVAGEKFSASVKVNYPSVYNGKTSDLGASITDYQHRSPAFYSTFPASASGAWCYKTIGTEYLQFNYIYSIVYITVDLRNYQQCPGDSVVADAYYNGSLTKAVKSFSLEAGSSSKVSFYPKCYQHGIYWYTQPGTYRFVLHDNTKNLDIMNISCNLYEKGFY